VFRFEGDLSDSSTFASRCLVSRTCETIRIPRIERSRCDRLAHRSKNQTLETQEDRICILASPWKTMDQIAPASVKILVGSRTLDRYRDLWLRVVSLDDDRRDDPGTLSGLHVIGDRGASLIRSDCCSQ